GEHQIGAAVHRYDQGQLRAMAKENSVSGSGTKAALVSRITAAATHGHYSANFPKATGEAKAPKAPAKRELPRASDIAKPLTAIRPIADYQINLRTAPDARFIAHVFGLHQLRQALDQRSQSDVRKAATHVQRAHPGTRPKSNSKMDLID